jgi:hypothetical protein
MLFAQKWPRLFIVLAIVLLGQALLAPASLAQVQRSERADRDARSNEFAHEKSVIEDLLQTIVGLVRDVTLAAPDEITTDRLFGLSSRLSGASQALARKENGMADGQEVANSVDGSALRADELEQARRLLIDLVDQTVDVRQELRMDGHVELADRMRGVENGLLDAVALIKKAEISRATGQSDRPAETDEYLSEGKYEDRPSRSDEWDDWAAERRRDRTRASNTSGDYDGTEADDGRKAMDTSYDGRDDCATCDENEDEFDGRHRKNGWDYDPETLIGIHVGELGYGWPYRETGMYRSIPAIRYNRVEGLVLGIRRLPLSWDDYERAKVYGHGGYAFGSKEWQYEIGAEARAGRYNSDSVVDFKLGGAYRKTTATQDIWKSSWVENSLAAFLFNYDFLDYFEVQGWTAYAAVRLTPLVQITGAYRQEEYRSLRNAVTWSLFGGHDFRYNPPINAGDMNTVAVAVEGGSVADLDWLPRGVAFRLEAEFGRDFGGDFDFNRYVGDVRFYLPFNDRSTLSLRARGGTATGTLPFQKAFTVGGIGSMRSYPQNGFVGTRMMLGNVEYTIAQDWLWDDIMVSGFLDAGWVNNAGTDKFDFDDIYPSIGAGIGLIDRSLRVEVSWPLRDIGAGREPSVWIRINPAF